jgi:hypothetical protein
MGFVPPIGHPGVGFVPAIGHSGIAARSCYEQVPPHPSHRTRRDRRFNTKKTSFIDTVLCAQGPSPSWYKSRSYRARAVREPRKLLAHEFGLQIPDDVAIAVHDSTADLRHVGPTCDILVWMKVGVPKFSFHCFLCLCALCAWKNFVSKNFGKSPFLFFRPAYILCTEELA